MIICQPFVDAGHPLHSLFPDPFIAIAGTVLIAIWLSMIVCSFIALVMIATGEKKTWMARP